MKKKIQNSQMLTLYHKKNVIIVIKIKKETKATVKVKMVKIVCLIKGMLGKVT